MWESFWEKYRVWIILSCRQTAASGGCGGSGSHLKVGRDALASVFRNFPQKLSKIYPSCQNPERSPHRLLSRLTRGHECSIKLNERMENTCAIDINSLHSLAVFTIYHGLRSTIADCLSRLYLLTWSVKYQSGNTQIHTSHPDTNNYITHTHNHNIHMLTQTDTNT